MPQMRRPSRIWSPKLEVDGVPIAWDSSVRHYHWGHTGHIVEALEQPLLLPKDMEAYRHFSQQELFLSLKRDLAMVSSLIYCPIQSLGYFHKFLLCFILKIKKILFCHVDYTTGLCGR